MNECQEVVFLRERQLVATEHAWPIFVVTTRQVPMTLKICQQVVLVTSLSYPSIDLRF